MIQTMEIKKVLENALNLSKEVSFHVTLVDSDNHVISINQMTYLCLGTYLMTRHESIFDIKITLKPGL